MKIERVVFVCLLALASIFPTRKGISVKIFWCFSSIPCISVSNSDQPPNNVIFKGQIRHNLSSYIDLGKPAGIERARIRRYKK